MIGFSLAKEHIEVGIDCSIISQTKIDILKNSSKKWVDSIPGVLQVPVPTNVKNPYVFKMVKTMLQGMSLHVRVQLVRFTKGEMEKKKAVVQKTKK